MKNVDIAVIGAGPAGLAAAWSARKKGIQSIAVFERSERPGGILPQCIHDGFGINEFHKDLTGPEYACRWVEMVRSEGIDVHTSCAVLSVIKEENGFRLKLISQEKGAFEISAKALILATGCRERTRGQLKIPGSRPAGVYTAGQVQYMMNIQNLLPGRRAVILGSGDIGLIMARRMVWEGITVSMVLGMLATGLIRNYVQCIKDWDIPISFGHTVVSIHGRKRVTGVTIAPVLADGSADLENKQYIRCDMLVIATGLISENEVWKSIFASAGEKEEPMVCSDDITTQIEGIWACGNVVKVYDTADDVSNAGKAAGEAAASYVASGHAPDKGSKELPAPVKHIITPEDMEYLESSESSKNIIYCVNCPKGCRMTVSEEGNVSGAGCRIGEKYACSEQQAPSRVVTTTVKIDGEEFGLLPVRTDAPVPKEKVFDVIKKCRKITAPKGIPAGSIVLKDVFKDGSGINVNSCADS